MTVTSFYVLYNFATGVDSCHKTLGDALLLDGVGSVDEWVIREVTNGSVTRFVTEGCGHSNRPAA